MLDSVLRGDHDYGLSFWTTEQCLVAPKSVARNPLFPEAARESARKGWPVYLRDTGGDLTPQGPGVLNISLALRSSLSVEAIYDILCSPILTLLNDHGASASCASVSHSFCDGRFNIAVGGRKLVGTAQRLRMMSADSLMRASLAHALVLVDADLPDGISAINRFYELCGIDKRVLNEAHLNFSELEVTRCHESATDWLTHRLFPLFNSEIIRATRNAVIAP